MLLIILPLCGKISAKIRKILQQFIQSMKFLLNFLHYCRKLSIFALEHWQYSLSEGAGATFVGKQ